MVTSDCRVNKRASASLSLRLPRGRPPALGVDSSFFNLTPPSAEALTPTEENKVITETVEQSVVVEAKEPVTNTPETVKESATENRTVEGGVTDNGVDRVSEMPITQIILTDQTPIITDRELPATETVTNTLQPESTERVDVPPTVERVVPVDLEGETGLTKEATTDKFVLAERPDYNPSPHS